MEYIDFCDKYIDTFYRMAFAAFGSSKKAAEAVEEACVVGGREVFRSDERAFAVKMFGILYSVCLERLVSDGSDKRRAALALRFASGLCENDVVKAYGKERQEFYKAI